MVHVLGLMLLVGEHAWLLALLHGALGHAGPLGPHLLPRTTQKRMRSFKPLGQYTQSKSLQTTFFPEFVQKYLFIFNSLAGITPAKVKYHKSLWLKSFLIETAQKLDLRDMQGGQHKILSTPT